MHFPERLSRWRTHFRLLLTGFLVVGLCLLASGCGGAGANDGNDGNGPSSSAPAAPSGLSATSGNGEVGLDWEAVDGADTYNVYRSTSSTSGATGTPLESGVSSASYTDSSPENGTTYYYRVTAVGTEDAESDGSGEVQITPFAEPPTRP